MEHLADRRIIEIVIRAYEPTEEERAHLKECEGCRRFVGKLILRIQCHDLLGSEEVA